MFLSETDRINAQLLQSAPLTLRELAERDITRFYASPKRRDMLTGERYYRGEHDILRRKRTAIGEGGKMTELDNLPNNRVVNNLYRLLVDQKVNYLLGKPVTLRCEDKRVEKKLKGCLNRNFFRVLKNVGEDALNCGLGWLYIYFGEDGKAHFKRFRPFEVIPAWSDSEHTELDYAVRLYSVICYEGKRERVERRAEVYTAEGVQRYRLDGARLIETEPFKPYCTIGGNGFGFGKIPLVPFKYNSKEIPLIKNVKTLQDGLNSLMSDFQNCMEEDVRNTILVIKNYDGEDLGQFRKNLSAYGAVKVKTVDGSQGGVETLTIDVNAENYKTIISIFKRAIIENGRGYDAKDDRLSGNPNQMNIMSMYNDIDIDATGMETEFAAALEQVLALVCCGDMPGVELTFNRSMIMNESELIDNIIKSKGLVDEEVLRAKHPWVR
jgi:SPP1 family phage portal protein